MEEGLPEMYEPKIIPENVAEYRIQQPLAIMGLSEESVDRISKKQFEEKDTRRVEIIYNPYTCDEEGING